MIAFTLSRVFVHEYVCWTHTMLSSAGIMTGMCEWITTSFRKCVSNGTTFFITQLFLRKKICRNTFFYLCHHNTLPRFSFMNFWVWPMTMGTSFYFFLVFSSRFHRSLSFYVTFFFRASAARHDVSTQLYIWMSACSLLKQFRCTYKRQNEINTDLSQSLLPDTPSSSPFPTRQCLYFERNGNSVNWMKNIYSACARLRVIHARAKANRWHRALSFGSVFHDKVEEFYNCTL